MTNNQLVDLCLGDSESLCVTLCCDTLYNAALSYSINHKGNEFVLYVQSCNEAYCQKCVESNRMEIDLEYEYNNEETWKLLDGEWLD
jgi:hypothetical protein